MPSDYPMLSRIHSSMLATKAQIIFEREMSKSCLPDIFPSGPVELEPPYQSLAVPKDLLCAAEQPSFTPALMPREEDWIRLKLWVPPGQDCDWVRNENVVKLLVALKHRIAFEIAGNQNGILLTHLCHKEDEAVVRAATFGFFPGCEFSRCRDHPLDVLPESAWQTAAVFEDFYTPPPYSHLLTRPSEIKFSPLDPLLNSLSLLVPPSMGLYQVVLQPVSLDHDWHRNVQFMIDLEFMAKLYGSPHLQQRFAQQAPSGQLQSMARDSDTKSHSDKPFFCAAVRIGLLGHPNEDASNALRALGAFMALFQHGGRPLGRLSQDDFLMLISFGQVRDMFRLGVTYRTGSLLNSAEISGLLHIPPLQNLKQRVLDVPTANPFPAHPEILLGGTHIGLTTSADGDRAVYIPDYIRASHIHIIGKPRVGKSCEIEYLCERDIDRGHGIAVLDPHGDLIEGILSRVPENALDRVIYFNPGHPELVPLWNPLVLQKGQLADRQADDLLRAFMQVTTGWGHRLETLIRQAFHGLVRTGDGTLFDASLVLSTDSESREAIRKRIVDVVDNVKAYHFWEEELKRYRSPDFEPVQHKLTGYLLHGTAGDMFSQPESRFGFREMMDNGMIFLADLSTIGSEVRDTLGSLLLSLVHLAALTRSDTLLTARKPFHVYVDEAHRFLTEAMEDMLVETRKYSVSMTFAHQYISQFSTKKKVDALGVVGTTVSFNVTSDDAPRMARILGGQVTPEDLTSLADREAIVRIGNRVAHIKTPTLSGIADPTMALRAKELSYQRYYKPAEEVKKLIWKKMKASPRRVAPGPVRIHRKNAEEEFRYDEFASS